MRSFQLVDVMYRTTRRRKPKDHLFESRMAVRITPVKPKKLTICRARMLTALSILASKACILWCNYKRNMNHMVRKSRTDEFMRRVNKKSRMEYYTGGGYTTFVYNSRHHVYRTFIFEVGINNMEMKI